MIILEGPDGSGKTTLLQILQERYQLPKHERFCTSDGPFQDLASLAYKDVQTMKNQELSIYDRHPFLSEYAYASAIPERVVRDEFLEGWAISTLQQFARSSLVILCLPPFRKVLQNVSGCLTCNHPEHDEFCRKVIEESEEFCPCTEYQAPHHMEGVADNIAAIYQMYRLLHVFWPDKNNIITYDYTDRNSLLRTFSRVQIHISHWKR